jgi:pentatricopeptide repeat protein
LRSIRGKNQKIEKEMTMQILKVGQQWGGYSWADGFIANRINNSEEVKKHPEAVINRLMREGRWDEAEEIMDKYVKIKEVNKNSSLSIKNVEEAITT